MVGFRIRSHLGDKKRIIKITKTRTKTASQNELQVPFSLQLSLTEFSVFSPCGAVWRSESEWECSDLHHCVQRLRKQQANFPVHCQGGEIAEHCSVGFSLLMALLLILGVASTNRLKTSAEHQGSSFTVKTQVTWLCEIKIILISGLL